MSGKRNIQREKHFIDDLEFTAGIKCGQKTALGRLFS